MFIMIYEILQTIDVGHFQFNFFNDEYVESSNIEPY
jgi:hypothetical protein